jgi:hypothetical protein
MSAMITGKCLITQVACLLFVQCSFGQLHYSIRVLDEADLSIDTLRSTLELTDTQVLVISALNDRYKVRFDSIRMSDVDRTVKFARTYDVKHERDDELKYILTEKQFRIYRFEQDKINTAFDPQAEQARNKP